MDTHNLTDRAVSQPDHSFLAADLQIGIPEE
jgi:hypothetical protein